VGEGREVCGHQGGVGPKACGSTFHKFRGANVELLDDCFGVIFDQVSRVSLLEHFRCAPKTDLRPGPATSGLCVRRVGGAPLGYTPSSRMLPSVIGGRVGAWVEAMTYTPLLASLVVISATVTNLSFASAKRV
jgi:hypothetical protein